MPVSSVFWPETVLPPVLRAIARAVPANHIFEGMRAVVTTGRVPTDRIVLATGLNLLYLAAAAATVAWVYRIALTRGLLPKAR
jgi:ABC-2 type transport system permease protein